MLEYIILGFLKHRDMSGYDIKQHMSMSTDNFYNASYGSIYPMLKKLEENGSIRSREELEGGKYKKLYSITPAGDQAFLQWLQEPITLSRTKHDHLVRIFFFDYLPEEKVMELMRQFTGYVQNELDHLAEVEERIAPYAGGYQSATLLFGQEYYRFVLDWCGRFLRKEFLK